MYILLVASEKFVMELGSPSKPKIPPPNPKSIKRWKVNPSQHYPDCTIIYTCIYAAFKKKLILIQDEMSDIGDVLSSDIESDSKGNVKLITVSCCENVADVSTRHIIQVNQW